MTYFQFLLTTMVNFQGFFNMKQRKNQVIEDKNEKHNELKAKLI